MSSQINRAKQSLSLAALVATVAVPLLVPAPAQAEWIKGDVVWLTDSREFHISPNYGRAKTTSIPVSDPGTTDIVFLGNAKFNVHGYTDASSTNPPSCASGGRIVGKLTQSFLWVNGNTPDETFQVIVNGSASAGASANINARSSAYAEVSGNEVGSVIRRASTVSGEENNPGQSNLPTKSVTYRPLGADVALSPDFYMKTFTDALSSSSNAGYDATAESNVLYVL